MYEIPTDPQILRARFNSVRGHAGQKIQTIFNEYGILPSYGQEEVIRYINTKEHAIGFQLGNRDVLPPLDLDDIDTTLQALEALSMNGNWRRLYVISSDDAHLALGELVSEDSWKILSMVNQLNITNRQYNHLLQMYTQATDLYAKFLKKPANEITRLGRGLLKENYLLTDFNCSYPSTDPFSRESIYQLRVVGGLLVSHGTLRSLKERVVMPFSKDI